MCFFYDVKHFKLPCFWNVLCKLTRLDDIFTFTIHTIHLINLLSSAGCKNCDKLMLLGQKVKECEVRLVGLEKKQ